MKTNIIIAITLLISSSLYGQKRTASKVYFESGKETIEGILIRPNDNENTPAVVFQQGSGKHSFEGYETEAWGPHKFYIEDVLLEQGYAVLYCNKRGLGESTGNWKKNDFYGRANDAYSAVTYLKSLPFIDSARIGVSGHSQGGWIAQIVAAQHDDIAFIICLAGPTVGVKNQMASFNKFMFECEGLEGEKLEKKLKRESRRSEFGARIGKVMPFIGGARYWYLISNYNNDDIISAISCPTLLLFAEFDANVDPEMNINHLNDLYDQHIPANFRIEIMPKGQHGFYIVSDRCVDWDTAMQQPFDQIFQDKVSNWLMKME